MQVLVTGGAGYIGSVLIPYLLENGYKVKCLDRFFFGEDTVSGLSSGNNLELIKDDVRWFPPKMLENVYAVIDLAALSNDQTGELDPSKTYDINYLGRLRVAKLAKEHGVKRYILASSCSVYGFQDGVLTEESSPNPLTTYSKASLKAEQDVLPLADDKFTVSSLRFATVYGLSPRMRFDLAINGMVLGLAKTGKIPVMKDGSQWRPFIHVKDVARAFLTLIEADINKVKGKVYNTGSGQQNYQIGALAEMIGNAISDRFELMWYGSPDFRSYKIDFSKIRTELGFKPEHKPEDAAREIYAALKSGKITDSLKTKTVDWYRHLLEMHKIVKEVEMRDTIL